MTKSEMRKLARDSASALARDEALIIDKKIEENFLSLDLSGKDRIFIYISIGHEVETKGIISRLLGQGKEVYVPLCFGKGIMEAKKITSLSELSCGMYGIPEPSVSAESIEPDLLSLIVVPGVAFGRDFSRLGRGAGYYDRFIESANGVDTVALARSISLYDAVSCDAHDRAVGMIVTENEILRNV